MRKIVLTSLVCLLFTSCIDFFKREKTDLNERIDSLEKVNAEYKADMENLTTFITVLSDGLDSIARQEDILISNNGREGNLDREILKKNLETFESMLSQQKQRISRLVDSLKVKGIKIEKLNNLVQNLNLQLDDKNRMIQSLKADIDKKNVSISQLRAHVTSLSEQNVKLEEKVERQITALTTQDEMINEGYIKIGTKKNLKNGGFLSGGFLKKTKVNYQNLPKDKFMRVDIRKFTQIPINSKKAKILTQMPPSSYQLTNTDDGQMLLQILDPNAFWSISNFLIIQID